MLEKITKSEGIIMNDKQFYMAQPEWQKILPALREFHVPPCVHSNVQTIYFTIKLFHTKGPLILIVNAYLLARQGLFVLII